MQDFIDRIHEAIVEATGEPPTLQEALLVIQQLAALYVTVGACPMDSRASIYEEFDSAFQAKYGKTYQAYVEAVHQPTPAPAGPTQIVFPDHLKNSEEAAKTYAQAARHLADALTAEFGVWWEVRPGHTNGEHRLDHEDFTRMVNQFWTNQLTAQLREIYEKLGR